MIHTSPGVLVFSILIWCYCFFTFCASNEFTCFWFLWAFPFLFLHTCVGWNLPGKSSASQIIHDCFLGGGSGFLSNLALFSCVFHPFVWSSYCPKSPIKSFVDCTASLSILSWMCMGNPITIRFILVSLEVFLLTSNINCSFFMAYSVIEPEIYLKL